MTLSNAEVARIRRLLWEIDKGLTKTKYKPYVETRTRNIRLILTNIDREKQIPTECDPQEVYFYEYNNHECMFAWDGDKEAVEIIIRHWGKDVAKSLKRYNASKI